MATIRDIAKLLVERHQVKEGAATEFLQQMVEVINDGLIKDRMVKIKGFGTFKIQEVKERGSINVNTGQPVVIAAHDKVTFTPDNVMRDLVNKPFSQFETVILNDNVPEAPEPEPELEPVAEPEPVIAPEPVPEPVIAPEPVPVIAPEPEPVPVIEPAKTTNAEPEKSPEEMPEPRYYEAESDKESHLWIHIVSVVVLAVIFFGLGYAAARYYWFEEKPKAVKSYKVVHKDYSDMKSAKKQQANVNQTPPKPVIVTPSLDNKTDVQEPRVKQDAYSQDPRVKHGAYIITGTAETVTVKKGQTLKGISKAYLGPGMECYVEAYNGKKEVQTGDKLLIPSLKHKKAKK